MEYFLCRAMEVCRLSAEQLARLQNHERLERVCKKYNPETGDYAKVTPRTRKCLQPFEIQMALGLPTPKEHYGIPQDDPTAHSAHNQRLRSEFRNAGLYPEHGDIGLLKVEEVHKFDNLVRSAVLDELKIDLSFRLSLKRRHSRELDEREAE